MHARQTVERTRKLQPPICKKTSCARGLKSQIGSRYLPGVTREATDSEQATAPTTNRHESATTPRRLATSFLWGSIGLTPATQPTRIGHDAATKRSRALGQNGQRRDEIVRWGACQGIAE